LGGYACHVHSIALVCLLAIIVACGDDAASTVDAASCQSTADPHDEDGDGIFDACDNCPATANPNQADTTEVEARAFPDGVGDVCDPRGGASGDDLRGFYSFASDTQGSAWTGSGWTISDDALHAVGNAAWATTRTQQGDGYFVLAQIASLSPIGAQGSVAIIIDGDGASTGAMCSLQATMLTAREVGGAESSVMLATAIAPAEPFTLIAWRTISLSGSLRIPEITCRLLRAGAMKDVTVTLTDETTTGSHVISAIDASVDISSLSVYTSPGPKNP
jgi:hypothetical protein